MKRILLLQTGGTIAMQIRRNEDGAMDNLPSDSLKKHIPELSEIAQIQCLDLFFKDSSDLSPSDWVVLARAIESNYQQFDGFVVLHGTDTMAYTASALSFCFKHLAKPVIFTGSQVPLSVIRSDAGRNLINAVQMATLPFCEVAICFNDKILRGNRSTKMSIGDFTAFTSPNHPPLAEIGIDIHVKHALRPGGSAMECYPVFSEELMVLRLFPGIKPSRYISLLNDNTRAVIISGYGSGNFPVSGEHSLLPFLEACLERNIFMVMASQAVFDAVDLEKYSSGRMARERGVISAGDMTMEAAITKMMFLLGRYSSPYQIRDAYMRSLRGELTIR
ncbi:MAG: asparaginase [Candidatus Cyclonatronum sp.]|uniref:asparaginase n=1 Tax=Cyclonatronum sp. TaxID=3024185 RepID=UPI0025C0DFA5|nr:asparaginase [Cyclonatronum sp.]MCC5932814.1 asparaginase [Balneolales bacterium]MCH8485604.1 asparaginase [Cyclonatronum sp.]